MLREADRFDEAAKAYEEVIDLVGKDKELTPKGREVYLKRYRYILSNTASSRTRVLADLALDIGGGGRLVDLAALSADGLLGRAPDPDVDAAVAAAAAPTCSCWPARSTGPR